MPWYPKRRNYFAPVAEGDEVEQGDIFWGIPVLVAQHPELSNSFQQPLATMPPAEALDPPRLSSVKEGITIHADPVIILPHTCDFYGPEKGRRNRVRLVARIERLVASGIADQDYILVRNGEGFNHTFFLPSWEDSSRDTDDMLVNLRYMTTVDTAYVSRRRRVARLSNAAIIALRRRAAHFFTDYAPAPAELSLADIGNGLIRNDRDLSRLGLVSHARVREDPAMQSAPDRMPWADWVALLNDMGFNIAGPWSLEDLKDCVAAHPSLDIKDIHIVDEDGVLKSVTVEVINAARASSCHISLESLQGDVYALQGIIMGSVEQ